MLVRWIATTFAKFEYDEGKQTTASHAEPAEAMVTDNNEPKSVGRPDKSKDDLRKAWGELLLTTPTVNLAAQNYVRQVNTGRNDLQQAWTCIHEILIVICVISCPYSTCPTHFQ